MKNLILFTNKPLVNYQIKDYFNSKIKIENFIFKKNTKLEIKQLLNQILDCDIIIIDGESITLDVDISLLSYILGYIKCLNTTSTHHIKIIFINGEHCTNKNYFKDEFDYFSDDLFDAADYINDILF